MKNTNLILLAFVLFTISTYSQKPKTRIEKIEEEKAIPYYEFNIPLIRLISNPEKYQGKTIQIKGYLNLEFEGNAIYFHQEDYVRSLTENSLWVEFSKDIIDKKNINEFSKKYVIIVGTFQMNSRGHMGIFGGTMKNITRLDYWDFKNE